MDGTRSALHRPRIRPSGCSSSVLDRPGWSAPGCLVSEGFKTSIWSMPDPRWGER